MMQVQRSNRPRVGQLLDVPGHGRCEVVSNADPSLIVMRTAQGTEFKIGDEALEQALMFASNVSAADYHTDGRP